MTDLEFDVMDELYFVTAFDELEQNLSLKKGDLKLILKSLIEKGWVKCLKDISEEVVFDEQRFSEDFSNYCYLATKAGLLAHNRID